MYNRFSGFFLIVFLLGTSLSKAQQKKSNTNVTINGSDIGRTFYGIGAISQGASARLLIDYPEPERSQILDYLFKPGYGASLQLLKVGIGDDTNATDGSEPAHMRGPHSVNCNRGWKWWLMEEAKKRNPNIKLIAQRWGMAGWLDGAWSQDNIDYQLAWMKCAEKHNLHINYIGGWNGKSFSTDGIIAYSKAVKDKYPSVKITEGDGHGGDWSIADSMRNNAQLMKAVDIMDFHAACFWRSHYRKCQTPKWVQNMDKPIWFAANAAEGWDAGAKPHTRALNRMYIDGRMTSYMVWNLVESRYGNMPLANTGLMGANWPWSGYYQLGKNIWAFAHTAQFIKPGWHYLNTGSKRLDDGATIVSLADSTSNDYSMILEGMDLKRPDTLSFQIKNLPAKPLHVWVSNMASDDSSDYFQNIKTIVPYKGRFTLVIQPNRLYSITSTTGQGKGHAQSQASIRQQLSLPYTEDFEEVSDDKMAPLYTSINGAFEGVSCKGRSGRCYEQAVSQQPHKWNKTGEMPPTAIVGDPRWWGNYSLQADVRLAKDGYAELVGRISGQTGWTTYLGGYHFQVGSDGWMLFEEDPASRTKDTLATGTKSIPPETWHTMKLRMQGHTIKAMLDGNQLLSVDDTVQWAGNVALRASKWNRAQFDNIKVDPVGSSPAFVPEDQISISNVSSIADFYHGWTFEGDNVLDGRLGTQWRSKSKDSQNSITLDLGKEENIQALWVRPRRPYFDRNNHMYLTRYRIEISQNGRHFKTIDKGRWSPTGSVKIVAFDRKYDAHFVRFTALNTTKGPAAITELKVIKSLPEEWPKDM